VNPAYYNGTFILRLGKQHCRRLRSVRRDCFPTASHSVSFRILAPHQHFRERPRMGSCGQWKTAHACCGQWAMISDGI